MGSSPLLRTHHVTIVADSDGRLLLTFSRKERRMSVQQPIKYVEEEEEEEQFRPRADSMDLFNSRGCDEIMC